MKVKNLGPAIVGQAAILDDLERVLASCALTTGEFNERLEKQFAAMNSVRFGVSCNSGGMALGLLFALLRSQKTRVIVPTNTHVATVSVALMLGYEVVVCDVTQEMMLDITDPLFKPDPDTVVVVVSIAGFLPSNMAEIESMVAKAGATLIVDAAHAHGTIFNGRPAGNFGLASTFSFYPTKLVVAGEGGMVLTDSRELNIHLQRSRDVGKVCGSFDMFVDAGFSSRMSNVLACIGWHQLQNMEELIVRRTAIAKQYLEVVGSHCRVLQPAGHTRPNWYKFVMQFDKSSDRVKFEDWMTSNGIEGSSKVFPYQLGEQPVVKERAVVTAGGVGLAMAASHYCLPLYIGIEDEKVTYVCETVRRFFE